MRLSLDQDDPAYTRSAHAALVFFEGSQRSNVITADEEKRYIKFYRLNALGEYMQVDGILLTGEDWGHVRIEAPDWLRDEVSKR